MDVNAKFDDLITTIELAGTYMEDGALRTAAARLRKAADIADELAEHKDQLLNEICQTEGAGA